LDSTPSPTSQTRPTRTSMVKLEINIDKRRLQRLIKKLESAEETLQGDATSSSFDAGAKREALRGAQAVSEILAFLYPAATNASPPRPDLRPPNAHGNTLLPQTL